MDREASAAGWHPSIFSKLLAIMLGMIAILVVMVVVFFAFVMFPVTIGTSQRATQQCATALAATSPSLESARKIHELAGMNIRYEGPEDSWTTSDSLPTVAQVRN